MPDEITELVLRIWKQHAETFKEDSREYLSDRRLHKVINLMRVSAFTNNRTEVDYSDVFLLKNCLWNSDKNTQAVNNLTIRELQTHEQKNKSKRKRNTHEQQK